VECRTFAIHVDVRRSRVPLAAGVAVEIMFAASISPQKHQATTSVESGDIAYQLRNPLSGTSLLSKDRGTDMKIP